MVLKYFLNNHVLQPEHVSSALLVHYMEKHVENPRTKPVVEQELKNGSLWLLGLSSNQLIVNTMIQ